MNLFSKNTKTVYVASLGVFVCGVILFAGGGITSAHNGEMHEEVSLSSNVTRTLDRFVGIYAEWPKQNRMNAMEKLTKWETKTASIENDETRMMLEDVVWYFMHHFHEVDMVIDSPWSASVDTRVMLAGYLHEHVDLGLNVLRNAYDGSADLEESLAELDENTLNIAEIIGSVYGADAEDAFIELWRNHIGFFADYTVGLKTNDESMMMEAREELEGYAQDAGDFFSAAIPSVMKDDVVAGAEMHAMHLLDSMDAYDEGDYEVAYRLQREAHQQVAGLAALLIDGIVMQFSEDFAEETVNPEYALDEESSTLRYTLNSLLKEHVMLGLNVLRNAYDGSDDFEESLAELDENTLDLSELIGSVYGNDAEDAFRELWRNHIGFFADYTVGLKTNDESMMMEARDNLMGYAIDAASFFSTAIPSLEMSDLQTGAEMHAMHLLDSMDAYDEGDYEEAYRLQREATTQIEGLANTLIQGIVHQNYMSFE